VPTHKAMSRDLVRRDDPSQMGRTVLIQRDVGYALEKTVPRKRNAVGQGCSRIGSAVETLHPRDSPKEANVLSQIVTGNAGRVAFRRQVLWGCVTDFDTG